jgi:hypothetical protein
MLLIQEKPTDLFTVVQNCQAQAECVEPEIGLCHVSPRAIPETAPQKFGERSTLSLR